MNHRDAIALIAGAVPARDGVWADLGAGDGTFTRALVDLLGPDGRVYAVDRNARDLASIAHWARTANAHVTTVTADFAQPLVLPGVDKGALDGLLLANSLHYIRDAGAVLARLVGWLRPGARAVIVEYDRRGPNRWVPYPIRISQLPELAAEAGLSDFAVTGTQPSAFGGNLYAAVAERAAPAL